LFFWFALLPRATNTRKQKKKKQKTQHKLRIRKSKTAQLMPSLQTAIATDAECQDWHDQKLFDTQCEGWCGNIKTQVSKKLFRKMQFINNDKMEAAGSKWMEKVCDTVGVPESKREAFWIRPTHGGMKAARAALNRRRMNVTNAMKKIFQGKYFAGMGCYLCHFLFWFLCVIVELLIRQRLVGPQF
jgi:hypothetical protein